RASRRASARVGPVVARAAAAARRHAPTGRQTGLIAVAALLVAWVLWERCGIAGCPDAGIVSSYQPGGASVVLDRNGERFAALAPVEHQMVPLDSLPGYVGQAFVAVEDRRFYRHDGVDWWRVLGALWADVRAGGLVEGSSTIPMQLSRNLYPERIRAREKTFRRKLLEVRLAREIEARFTKHEILELYLNHIYFGGGAYGIEAASRYYFGKGAPRLTLEEAALLAALPKAPAHFDPRRHPEAARRRRDLVLGRMERQDYLRFRAAEEARQKPVAVTAEGDLDRDGDVLAPYFLKHIRRLLEEELGRDLYAEPLRIITTLDAGAQRAAEEELAAQLRAVESGAFGWLPGPRYASAGGRAAAGAGYLQGAVVFMDARVGDVLAWVGGRDYDHSRFDRARLGRRQAGSTFKPFVYAAALEQGFSPSQPIQDAPFRLATGGRRVWEPENYSGRFEGRMSMREALTRSQNVPSVRLAAAVGEEDVADFARRAGIRGEVPASPVAVLGVTAVSPLELTAAFSTFAARGTRVAPRFVLRVEDEAGEVVWASGVPERVSVTTPAVAFVLTDMLRDAVDYGTGTGARWAGFRGPAAGKTGTTTNATDVWFVGYTPGLVGTVWIGFDETRSLPARATGGAIAAPVWGRIMARMDRGASADWDPVPGVVALLVDPESGLALEDGCRPRWGSAQRELFLAGQEPPTVCPRGDYDYFWDRVGGWFDGVFGSEPEPMDRGDADPDLGAPRLPRRDYATGENRPAEVRDRRARAEERASEGRRRGEERLRRRRP
ncbi:MAG TPA: PBP1A family penicillin-binding protein, partial [Longimicrobiales bacterium]|nr:PBP1A family penicillin-binding protein [Longimicrobiales bacterium]